MKICFFGAYDPAYPRNAVIRRGLGQSRVDVVECPVKPGPRFWVRYPLLLARFASLKKRIGDSSFFGFFLPEFCHKDVPLAKVLSLFSSAKIIFDPLASRFETKIIDWRRKKPGSVSAWWNYEIDRRVFQLSDLILADTKAHKEYYCQEFGVAAEKVEVLPVGFDDRIFGSESISPTDASQGTALLRVLFFGSFLPLHGAETIVEAARLVLDKAPSIYFAFIGSGQTYPAARQKAAELGLGDVRFEGWLPQAELAQKISREADICLGIFGRTEKARRVVPHKVFQAMAAGKPVITLRTPAAQEFFAHGETVYFCSEPRPEALAEAILDLSRDERLRQRIARQARALVWEKYSPAALGLELKGILEKRFGRKNSG